MAANGRKEKSTIKRKEKTPKKIPLEELKPATKPAGNTVPTKKPNLAQQSKNILKEFAKVQIASTEDLEKMLTMIALGMVQDRFGMDASLDTRLKAIDQITKIKQQQELNKQDTSSNEEVVIIDDIG